jgi:hypothetical protein
MEVTKCPFTGVDGIQYIHIIKHYIIVVINYSYMQSHNEYYEHNVKREKASLKTTNSMTASNNDIVFEYYQLPYYIVLKTHF